MLFNNRKYGEFISHYGAASGTCLFHRDALVLQAGVHSLYTVIARSREGVSDGRRGNLPLLSVYPQAIAAGKEMVRKGRIRDFQFVIGDFRILAAPA